MGKKQIPYFTFLTPERRKTIWKFTITCPCFARKIGEKSLTLSRVDKVSSPCNSAPPTQKKLFTPIPSSLGGDGMLGGGLNWLGRRRPL